MHNDERMIYEGTSCTLALESPVRGIIVLTISGHDVGEFGPAPMIALDNMLGRHESQELFIDARDTKGASIEVSSEWAQWLGSNRQRFQQVNMLTGSRFIEITAKFVRNFSQLEDVMRVYSDAKAFDEALADSLARRGLTEQ
jgi:hypothetical protein